jgi:hypothetical protein
MCNNFENKLAVSKTSISMLTWKDYIIFPLYRLAMSVAFGLACGFSAFFIHSNYVGLPGAPIMLSILIPIFYLKRKLRKLKKLMPKLDMIKLTFAFFVYYFFIDYPLGHVLYCQVIGGSIKDFFYPSKLLSALAADVALCAITFCSLLITQKCIASSAFFKKINTPD